VSIHQKVTCPQCWKIFDAEDILWVSVSPKLKGDSRLPEGQLRFLPSRYDLECNAIDPEDLVCHELACPRCRLRPAGAHTQRTLKFCHQSEL
jgi:hypothetical protein